MEPIEKAVLKALNAKRMAADDPQNRRPTAAAQPNLRELPKPDQPKRRLKKRIQPIARNTVPTLTDEHKPTSPGRPARQSGKASTAALSNASEAHSVFEQSKLTPPQPTKTVPTEAARRENARKQLFPGGGTFADKQPLRASKSQSQLANEQPIDQELTGAQSDTSTAVNNGAESSQITQALPNGAPAMLDPKALDELVKRRLEQEPSPRVASSEEMPSDALHLVRLLDRELGVWEHALRTRDKKTTIGSRDRCLELHSQIPPTMARSLGTTIKMLSQETESMGTATDQQSVEETGTDEPETQPAPKTRPRLSRRRRPK